MNGHPSIADSSAWVMVWWNPAEEDRIHAYVHAFNVKYRKRSRDAA